jgi:hypothetical protein
LVELHKKKKFQIKTLVEDHNCGSHYYNKWLSIKWAVHRSLDNFWDQRDFKANALKEMIRNDYNVELTLLCCHRAKKMALDILDGRNGEQYKHTREYASALLLWNLGSLAYIHRDGMFFQQMYILLVAYKQCFLAGCRPMICVDVCFMKEKLGWQLHAAIARDANDDIFSIAYAICETENRDTWTWFLRLLLEDIGY